MRTILEIGSVQKTLAKYTNEWTAMRVNSKISLLCHTTTQIKKNYEIKSFHHGFLFVAKRKKVWI